ncbi:MAG: hypothetical protein HYZ38_07545 [Mycobacterium sp.]|jgi:hypothetical protein|nr:hypothetical protein [Mycobacterium sp.]
MADGLSRLEILKDSAQELVQAGAVTAGQVASIVTTAIGDVAKAVGGFATDAFEIGEGARNAVQAADDDEVYSPPGDDLS